MAEAFGVAASAIQVADAGFKLYGALSRYVRGCADAEKSVKRLADEIRTTSWALQQLEIFLQQDQDLQLCKPEVITETEIALNGCRTAFEELRCVVKDFIPQSEGSIVPSSQRLKWPFKKDKALLLLTNFERLKTTLLLVLKVLSYASKLATKGTQGDLSLLDDETQVTYVLQAKRHALEVERELRSRLAAQPTNPVIVGRRRSSSDLVVSNDHIPLPSLLVSTESSTRDGDADVVVNGTGSNTSPSNQEVSAGLGHRLDAERSIRGQSTAEPDANPQITRSVNDVEHNELERTNIIEAHLDNCAAAVTRLNEALEKAKGEVQKNGILSLAPVSDALRSIRRAVDRLAIAEHELSSETLTGHRRTVARWLNTASRYLGEPHNRKKSIPRRENAYNAASRSRVSEASHRMTHDLTGTQTHATLEGSRRTVAGWLGTAAEHIRSPMPQIYDDAGFRRGRAMRFPQIPGEEMRNPALNRIDKEWTTRHPSREPSIHSVAEATKERSDTSDKIQLPLPAHTRPSGDSMLLPILSEARDRSPPAIAVTPDPSPPVQQSTYSAAVPEKEQYAGLNITRTIPVDAIVNIDEVEDSCEVEELVRRWTTVVL